MPLQHGLTKQVRSRVRIDALVGRHLCYAKSPITQACCTVVELGRGEVDKS